MPARATTPRKQASRRIKIGLFWGGLVLCAAGALLLALPAAQIVPPGVVLGAGLVALGLNVLLGGDFVAGPEPRTYSARGQVVRGRVEINAGLADVSLRAGPGDRVATVTFGPFGNPEVGVDGGVASVRLKSPRLRPAISRWRAELADNVLWDVEARSGLGNLALDLRRLRLERVQARSVLGRVHVTCPDTRGSRELELHTVLGEIVVTLPEGVGAQITIKRGALGSVRQKNERLLAPGPGRYITADYDTAAARVDIRIASAAGDITLV